MGYPVEFKGVLLGNSVTVDITVDLTNNVQVAEVTFNGAAGVFNTITLSPTQPKATNKTSKAGSQVLTIEEIIFNAAFGITKGKIQCKGTATDPEGNDPAVFDMQIAKWG